jgi:formate dehydrogenase subunit gamma
MAEPARDFDANQVRDIAAAHSHLPGALLPILQAVQDAFGCVDERAEPIIADVLNLTRAEVHGVVTFYHDFRRKPAGRHVLTLCRAEACQSAGGEALAARAEAALGIASGETTADGRTTLGAVYCLGLCALAPAAMIDGRPVARLDGERLDTVLKEAQE